MRISNKALLQACDELGIDYTVRHLSQNIITVHLDKNYLFLKGATPVNSHAMAQLCLDKDFFYTTLSSAVRMPMTKSFLLPDCNERYKPYRTEQSMAAIADRVEETFSYPLIVKKNKGSVGANVFKVMSREELSQAFVKIFNRNSRLFDYVALAQEYIDIRTEYRLIYLNRTLQFAYEKDVNDAQFVGNLSPLHWAGGKARLITDDSILQQLKRFCAPIFDHVDLQYCGLDILVDTQGQYWLLEANSAPNFDAFVRDEGIEPLVSLYKEMLGVLGA